MESDIVMSLWTSSFGWIQILWFTVFSVTLGNNGLLARLSLVVSLIAEGVMAHAMVGVVVVAVVAVVVVVVVLVVVVVVVRVVVVVLQANCIWSVHWKTFHFLSCIAFATHS